MSVYRADVDGLRAVAVCLVVGYHAGLAGFSGGFVGVDVFFVISGFLVTGLLLTEAEQTGTVNLGEFYARRARRLLPLAGLVLAVTATLGVWLTAPLARGALLTDIRAAAVFVANWRFAARSVDYAAVEASGSLVNHWWSLAVEEQFYLVWPLVVVLIATVVFRTSRLALRPVLFVVLAAVLAVSLVTSVRSGRAGPAAYFFTHTRLWEIAAGALLAVAVGSSRRPLRVPRPVREFTAFAGMGLIGWSAFTFDGSTVFPGSAALVPVTGALLVLLAGCSGYTSLGRLLGVRPLRRVGLWSYAWYLWHWPLLGLGMLAASRFGWGIDRSALTVLVVVGSLLVAAASHRFVENPVRHTPRLTLYPARSLAVGAVAVLAPVATGFAAGAFATTGDEPVLLPALMASSGQSVLAEETPGATASVVLPAPPPVHTVRPDAVDPAPLSVVSGDRAEESPDPAATDTPAPSDAPPAAGVVVYRPTLEDLANIVLPVLEVPMSPSQAASDTVDLPGSGGCNAGFATETLGDGCVFGDPAGLVDVVLVGDSHAQHWLPAVDAAGRDRGWRVHAFTKNSCPAVAASVWNERMERVYAECASWHVRLAERVATLEDAVVVWVNTQRYPLLLVDADGTRLQDPSSLVAAWATAVRSTVDAYLGAASLVVRVEATPWSPVDVPSCLAVHRSDPLACNFELTRTSDLDAALLAAEWEEFTAVGLGDRYRLLDVTSLLCPTDPCVTVHEAGIVKFRDRHHLTQTFSRALAGHIGILLDRILADAPRR